MTYTTLNKIYTGQYNRCDNRLTKLLDHLGKKKPDDEPLSLQTVLDVNGLDCALDYLKYCEGVEQKARLFAVWCVRQVQERVEQHYVNPKSFATLVESLNVAEQHANGTASDNELTLAQNQLKVTSKSGSEAARWALGAAMNACETSPLVAASFASAFASTAMSWVDIPPSGNVYSWNEEQFHRVLKARQDALSSETHKQEIEFKRVFCKEH